MALCSRIMSRSWFTFLGLVISRVKVCVMAKVIVGVRVRMGMGSK